MKVKEIEKWMNLSGNEYRIFLSNAKLEILTMVTLSDKYEKNNQETSVKILKVQILWEGHKYLKRSPTLYWMLLSKCQNKVVDYFKFCGRLTIYEL